MCLVIKNAAFNPLALRGLKKEQTLSAEIKMKSKINMKALCLIRFGWARPVIITPTSHMRKQSIFK